MAQTLSWIVVADASRGRILVQERLGAPLRRAYDEEDLVDAGRGRPGRSGARHPVAAAEAPPAAPTLTDFIADIVSRAARERRFQRLILIAPPQMLGELRKSLTPHARALVSAEIGKDLVRLRDIDIADHLGPALLSPMATPLLPSSL